MPAVEKEVSHKSGWRPEIGVGQVLPVPALVVVQEQYHAAEDKVDHDYAQKDTTIAKGQEEHAEKEVKGVVVDDIRVEDERVDQPDHKQEDGTPYGHRCCPVGFLEAGESQADPGQHHECRGGAAFKRTDEYAKRVASGAGADDAGVPGADHDLEVHNDHAGKGEEPSKIEAVQAGGAWGVGGECVGQGFVFQSFSIQLDIEMCIGRLEYSQRLPYEVSSQPRCQARCLHRHPEPVHATTAVSDTKAVERADQTLSETYFVQIRRRNCECG